MFPPTLVEYENTPLVVFTATTCTSSTSLDDACGATSMTTLSAEVGIGLIVPLITYACVPINRVPGVGLVKITGPEEVAAIGNQNTRETTARAATRNFILMVSLQLYLGGCGCFRAF